MKHLWDTEDPAGHAIYCAHPGAHSTRTYCAADPADPPTMRGRASRAWRDDHPGAVITPCVVCATQARRTGKPFWADRGMDWPTAEVAGHEVHLGCAHDAERRVRGIEAGQLAIDGFGVGRWASSGHAIPDECAALFAALGVAPALDPEATAAARDTETTEALARYRAWRAEHGYSREERAEMAAAFGTGETVVDVITGTEIRL